MGLLQEWIRKKREQKEAGKEFERRQNIQDNFEQKKLSANERELMKWKEKERQIQIKAELEAYRKIENNEIWSGRKSNPLAAPNITSGDKDLFKNNENIFAKKSELFNQQDLFFGK